MLVDEGDIRWDFEIPAKELRHSRGRLVPELPTGSNESERGALKYVFFRIVEWNGVREFKVEVFDVGRTEIARLVFGFIVGFSV